VQSVPSRRAVGEAPAKINLRLRVLGRRADGFHDIDTLFQAIELHDTVTVSLEGDAIALDVDGPDLGPPWENLAVRAALAYRDAADGPAGVRITLTKRIPAGAGLGGGSSDAAAVLAALAALSGDADQERLRAIGATLGSDVPFFLCGSATARGRGRGELLQKLEPLPIADLVVVTPPVHVSTAEAYAALRAGSVATDEAGEGGDPAVGAVRTTAWAADWGAVIDEAVNDFEPVLVERHPEVRRSLEALRDGGARVAILSGSGGASFGVFADAEAARAAAVAIGRRLGWPALATRSRGRLPTPEIG
jgi:4-diphosphocytidyl-2-C-methyl-D-erythritol kinase